MWLDDERARPRTISRPSYVVSACLLIHYQVIRGHNVAFSISTSNSSLSCSSVPSLTGTKPSLLLTPTLPHPTSLKFSELIQLSQRIAGLACLVATASFKTPSEWLANVWWRGTITSTGQWLDGGRRWTGPETEVPLTANNCTSKPSLFIAHLKGKGLKVKEVDLYSTSPSVRSGMDHSSTCKLQPRMRENVISIVLKPLQHPRRALKSCHSTC